jgi:S1-C subfamily serine protease
MIPTLAAAGSGLSADYREALTEGCRRQSSGGVEYHNCIRETLARFDARTVIEGADDATEAEKSAFRLACAGPRSDGLLAYDDCMRLQYQRRAGEAVRQVTVAPGAPRGPASAAPTGTTALRPEALFSRVSPSVYYVLALPGHGNNGKSGSAVAIDTRHLLTNCHVVSGFANIYMSDGTTQWRVTTLASDKASDRCILSSQIPLHPIPGIRAYSSLVIGEHVYTIGNPSGLQHTFGDGLISGLREKDGIQLVQTTAPISPGSSGGGLIDAEGRLVGITTFYIGEMGSLNFAISADEYVKLLAAP